MIYGRLIPRIFRTVSDIFPATRNFASSSIASRRFYSVNVVSVFSTARAANNFKTIFSLQRRCGFCSRYNSRIFSSSPLDTICFYSTDLSTRPSTTATTAQEQEAAQETAKVQYTEKLKRNTRVAFYVLGGSVVAILFGSIFAYGKPRIDPDGNVIHDEFTDMPLLKQYVLRTWNEYVLWYYYIVEPSSEKLLPDPLPPPYYQPKYTLVLELNGVLIHPEWSYSTGWRFKKRPALDKFVNDVGYPHFEVVIYTSEQGAIAHPLMDNIDPEWRFMHRLYRDATKYMNRAHVKDLSKLNRDLSKVIMVDWDSQAFQLNPENALRVPKWQGDDEDRALIDLASLLLMIADSNVDDVRTVCQYYSQFDDPIKAYVENRRKILEEKLHKLEQKKDHHQESLTKNFAGRLFGYKRHTSS